MYYINLFFFFSFIGFIYENIIRFIPDLEFDSGFMYGPWIPIYGFAIFLIIIVDKFLKKQKFIKMLEIVLFFVIITILVTILEYIGGHIVYLITKEHYWDYSWSRFNFGKYICLEISIVWGIFATLINYLVYPKIQKIIKRIPQALTLTLISFFLLDLIITITTK